MRSLSCFKAYDVRGKLGEELNEDIAYRIGRAFAQHLKAKKVVIGADIRLSSESLKQAAAKGLMDAGCDVIDIGMTGTEEVYFSAFSMDVDGAIEVTASHNPIDYNGMKFVGRGALPISNDSGLQDIKRLADSQDFNPVTEKGTLSTANILDPFVEHLLTYVQLEQLTPLKIVTNAGNGSAGHVIDLIEEKFKAKNIPIEFIKIHHEADGTFPNGIPNPLLVENRSSTRDAVIKHKADMGIAWDGDFDRCFFFDERGDFIEGYYLVGLLAEAFLLKSPGEKIIHDPRLTWNTIDIAEKTKGTAVQSKTGHAFIKEIMRRENAIYGGEMSAHHYFRDFAYCDSGMIPWLLVAELISMRGKALSSLVEKRMQAYPCSGEINYVVSDSAKAIAKVKKHYEAQVTHIDLTDGISMAFSEWRLNLRSSNTEPVLRLNVESKQNMPLVNEQVAMIESLLEEFE